MNYSRCAALLLVILFSLGSNLLAQQIEDEAAAEKAEAELNSFSPEEQIRKLNQIIVFRIQNGQLEHAQNLSQQMLQLAEEQQNEELILMALTRRSQSLYVQGKYGASIVYLQRLVQMCADAGIKDREASFRNFLANAAMEMGSHQLAIVEYTKSFEIYRDMGDPEGQAGILNNIALIYRNEGNLNKELEYYQRSLEIGKANDLKKVTAIALSNIGESYRHLGNFEEAEDYLLRGLQISSDIEDYDGQTYSLMELANLRIEQSRLPEASRLSQQAKDMAETHGFDKDLFLILLQQGRILLLQRNFAAAESKADHAETLGQKLDLTLERPLPVALRADIAEERGDLATALALQKQVRSMENEIDLMIRDERVAQLQAQFELDRSEQSASQARAQAANTEKDLRNLMLLVAMLVIMLGMIYWFYLAKLRSNRDIREKNQQLKEAYQKMEKLASTDDLTGLMNRRALRKQIEHERDRQERSKKPMCFIIADVDHFKEINDSLGHDAGDQALQWISEAILTLVRKQDTVCRWGGEEFFLLLPETDLAGGQALAEKLVHHFRNNDLDINACKISITLTAGVAQCGPDDKTRECIEAADKAMYDGKMRGRNQVQIA